MRLGANFLTKIIVGSTIGFGTLAAPSSAQAQDKPIAEKQIEIEKVEELNQKKFAIIIPLVLYVLCIIVLPYLKSKTEKNYLGETIDKIDWAKPIDVDEALESLIKLRDNQGLLPEKQVEIRDILTKFIPTLEKVKEANDKEILTKPLLRKMYFELEEALEKLNIALNPEPENELTFNKWKKLSTGIQILPKY